MSKNLTRKGLALGTAVAFGASAFAGSAPAMAVGSPSVSLLPAYGTGYSTFNDFVNWDRDDFSNIFLLRSTVSNTDESKDLIYKIDNASGANIEWGYENQGSADSNDDAYDAYIDLFVEEDTWGGSDDEEIYVNTGYQNNDPGYFLALGTRTQDQDVSIKVTAFIDTDGDGELNAGEGDEDVVSSVRTITFYEPSSVTTTATLDAPVYDSSELNAVVTFSKDINAEQLAYAPEYVNDWACCGDYWMPTQVAVEFSERPGDYNNYDSDFYVEWNSDDKKLEGYVNAATIEEGTYSARAIVSDFEDEDLTYDVDWGDWSDWDDNSVEQEVEKASNKVVIAPTVDELTLSAVTGANVTDSPDDGDYDYGVRSGTKSITYEAEAVDNDGDAVEGAEVTFTVSDDGLAVGSTVSAGGKTLTTSSDDLEVTVKTNKDGIASLTLTANKGLADDAIEVEAETVDENDGTGADDGYDNSYAIWEDAVVDDFVETSAIDYDYYPARSIQQGGSFTLNYLVLDQFNQPTSVDGDYDLRVGIVAADGNEFDLAKSASVVNGKASFTITDDSVNEQTDYQIDATLYDDEGDSISDTGFGWDSKIYVNLEKAAAKFTDYYIDTNNGPSVDEAKLSDFNDAYSTDDIYSDVSYEDFATGKFYEDVDFGDLGENGDWVDLGVTVLDANGSYQPGAPVTVKAPGLLIQDYEYEDQASTDTYTAPADSGAWFEVYLYSHKSGIFPVTITSGSASWTVNVKFSVDTSDVDSSDVTLSLSHTAGWAKGSVDVNAMVTDKFGNGIEGEDVDFSKTGIGFLDDTSATTDENGVAHVTLVGGSAGASNVTADSYDSFDDMTATKLVRWWSKTASATAGSKAGQVLVYGSAVAGDRVVVKVNGKKVAAFNAAAKHFSYTVKGAAAGTNDVIVKINKKKVFQNFLTVK